MTGEQVTTYESGPRRLHGLRMPVLPTGSWVGQVLGAAAVLGGVWMQFGLNYALIVGGVGSILTGALREAKKI